MKYKITEVYNKENGHLCGYKISYKPFPFVPYWVECKSARGLYKTIEEAEHDIIWLMSLDDKVKHDRRYL